MIRLSSVGPMYNWVSMTTVFEPGITRGLARMAKPVMKAQPADASFGVAIEWNRWFSRQRQNLQIPFIFVSKGMINIYEPFYLKNKGVFFPYLKNKMFFTCCSRDIVIGILIDNRLASSEASFISEPESDIRWLRWRNNSESCLCYY